MLAEIRTYTLHPGVRDEFVAWFESEVLPTMEDAGMRVLGPFVSADDPDVFVYTRWWRNDEERVRVCSRFYESDAWLAGMRDRALELEREYAVQLVRSTSAARLPDLRLADG